MDWEDRHARFGYYQANLLAGTAYSLADRARRDSMSDLLVPCYPPGGMTEVMEDCAVKGSGDHLLVRIDVRQFLPEVPPGVDTAVLIDFRQHFDDERRRLIYAVERLVKEAAKAHGAGEPGAWFTVAAITGAVAGPVGAVAGSVAVNWAQTRSPASS